MLLPGINLIVLFYLAFAEWPLEPLRGCSFFIQSDLPGYSDQPKKILIFYFELSFHVQRFTVNRLPFTF